MTIKVKRPMSIRHYDQWILMVATGLFGLFWLLIAAFVLMVGDQPPDILIVLAVTSLGLSAWVAIYWHRHMQPPAPDMPERLEQSA